MALFQFPVVLAVGQWIAGYFLKKWPAFPNLLIPVATFVLALLGYSVVPIDVHAGTLGDVLKGPGGVFFSALVQNLMVTGMHGTWKNTVFPALAWAFHSIGGKK